MSSRLTRWVLGGVLRAHPARFRAHYGREILVTIRDQRRAIPNVTTGRIAIFWARVLVDLVRSAVREQTAAVRTRVTRSAVRGTIRTIVGCLLVAFAIGNVAYDLSEPKLSMGVFALLLTSVSGLAGVRLLWRRSTGRLT